MWIERLVADTVGWVSSFGGCEIIAWIDRLVAVTLGWVSPYGGREMFVLRQL